MSADEAELHELLSELVQVNSRLIQAVRRLARENGSGDSLATWRTLGVLQRGGPVRLGVLAEASQVAQPTMTKLVAGLAERGWAERLPDVADARAWLIGITDAGSAELHAWRSGLASALLPYFAGVDADEVASLRRSLRLIESRIAVSEPVSQQEVAH